MHIFFTFGTTGSVALGAIMFFFSVCNLVSSEIMESHLRTQVLSAAKVTVNVEQCKTSTIFKTNQRMHILV